jgi:hypothetical protein
VHPAPSQFGANQNFDVIAAWLHEKLFFRVAA